MEPVDKFPAVWSNPLLVSAQQFIAECAAPDPATGVVLLDIAHELEGVRGQDELVVLALYAAGVGAVEELDCVRV